MSCGCQSPHFHLSLSQCLPSIPCFLNLSFFFFLLISTPLHLLVPVKLGKRVASKGNRRLCYFVIQPPTMFWRCQPLCRYSKKRLFYSKHFVADFSSRSCLESIVSHSTRMWKVFRWKHGVYITYTKRQQHLTTKWAPAEFWVSYKVSYLKKPPKKTPLALTSWYAFNFKRKAKL